MISRKRQLREYTTHLIRSLLFWMFALPLFAAFRYFGVNYEPGLTIDQNVAHLYRLDSLFISYAFVGILIGILYATIEFTIDKCLNRYLPIGISVLINTILVSIAVILCAYFAFKTFYNVFETPYDITLGWWYQDRSFWAHLLYIPFASLVFSLIVIVSDKFGKNLFWKILLGHYKGPKEENRIFMFLDLKDSTSIAEKIGHIRYSQLLQDFFYDLNILAPKFGAEIYQYIGDEVVLSWSLNNGAYNQNCIELFFSLKERIRSKSEYYIEKYVLIPDFKAGLHGGNVTAVEVGVVKKELAYHGDVVNTAARIQGECNTYKESFLISNKLLRQLERTASYRSKLVGKVLLKGKSNHIELFAIHAGK